MGHWEGANGSAQDCMASTLEAELVGVVYATSMVSAGKCWAAASASTCGRPLQRPQMPHGCAGHQATPLQARSADSGHPAKVRGCWLLKSALGPLLSTGLGGLQGQCRWMLWLAAVARWLGQLCRGKIHRCRGFQDSSPGCRCLCLPAEPRT